MGLSFDYFEQYTGTVWRVESSWTFKELVARATVDPAKKGGCIPKRAVVFPIRTAAVLNRSIFARIFVT